VWLGRCACCRTLTSQEPVHDCCNHGSCHRDSDQPPAGKQCPHQASALENYAQVDPVSPVAVAAAVSLDAGPELAPPQDYIPAFETLVAHSPPDLYLRNSVLLL
jgi:hypothetical protein